MEARQLAARMEASRSIGDGHADSFAGYGLLGLAFATGHVLAFRRVTASSIGPPFSSVWQRSPEGIWTVHTNVDAMRSCARYLGSAVCDVRSDDIEVKWRGRWEVSITARRARLHLALRLAATPATALLGAAARLLPPSVSRRVGTQRRLTAAAARLLGVERLTLSGRTPTGYAYQIRPRALWSVQAAAAVLDGREIGPAVQLREAIAVGDFHIPARGLFAAGTIRLVRIPGIHAIQESPGRDTILRRVLVHGSATTVNAGTGRTTT
ncbi:hypothetical protein BH23GEM9_BH23GEM9_17300 [soil metagenome]